MLKKDLIYNTKKMIIEGPSEEYVTLHIIKNIKYKNKIKK